MVLMILLARVVHGINERDLQDGIEALEKEMEDITAELKAVLEAA